MAKSNSTGDLPFRETEEAAYHAYREWPVWLALREKELQALQAPTVPAMPSDEQETVLETQKSQRKEST